MGEVQTVNRHLEVAVKAARQSGSFIIENLSKVSMADVDMKQASDFVTYVDRESEAMIINTIKKEFPEHTILAEESMREEGEYLWIIDPLDGTTNYIHGYPMFAVSIALKYEDETRIGVVLDPLRDELFTAIKGDGAYMNGQRISVSGIQEISNSLITTGFPFRNKKMIDPYLRLFRRLFYKVSDIRRAGSAALDLAHLACGRCDGFFELGLSPWDVAAGSLLIKEAGGIVTDFGGGNEYINTGNIVASTPALHEEILKEVKDVFRGVIDR
jgi:myo-inositol-1(or 4)-monophosphatase